eukprot:8042513-Pyramimonas_sp.AAC.1
MGGGGKGKPPQQHQWPSWGGNNGGYGKQWQPRGLPRGRDDDRDRDSRRRRRDSPSSGSDGGRQAKLDRARKYLAKHKDEYRQVVKEKAEKEKKDSPRRQGEILAKAMEVSFNQSVQQQVVQPLQAGGLLPPAPPRFAMVPA